MKLVLLAAGHGTRFGGLKQIAPVGPRGEALMDYTARFAAESGYDGIVLVVREEIREQVVTRARARWGQSLPIEVAVQSARPGTAHALMCTRPFLDGPFAVANADDLYEQHALAAIRDYFAFARAERGAPMGVLVAYQLTKTVLTSAEVKRGICSVADDQRLVGIEEHRVRLRADGRFDAVPLTAPDASRNASPTLLSGKEPVSMNLWGFDASFFDDFAELTEVESRSSEREVLLPEIVGRLLAEGRIDVSTVRTTSRCYGITHKDDVALVREHLELLYGQEPTRTPIRP